VFQGNVRRHTELGETTVKRTVREFLKNGFTVVYRIDLSKVEALDPTLESEIETGATVAGVPGPPRPPNHPKTIHKPPTRRREAAADEEAMKEWVAPEDLLRAVQAYATDSAGFTRSKVCFSDNWFQSRRWLAFVERQAEDREKTAALEANHHTRLASWISDSHPMCKHITAPQVAASLASKLVTQAQIQATGLRS
jgi:hypothetical protein